MNKKLLMDLFSIYAPSMEEFKLTDYICKYLDELGVPYERTRYNNIVSLNHKGKPVLCAHQDCVGKLEDGKMLRFLKIEKDNLGKDCLVSYGNIAGDDKCGIFIILSYLAEVSKEINFILTVSEEMTAPWGIPYVLASIKDNEVWKSVPYVLTLDRKGSSDILCTKNFYGSLEFENQLAEVGKDFGYKPAKGYFSDCDFIRFFKNCCNLSVGYYNAHTHQEFVVIDEMMNALEYVKAVVERITEPVIMPKADYSFKSFINNIKMQLLDDPQVKRNHYLLNQHMETFDEIEEMLKGCDC